MFRISPFSMTNNWFSSNGTQVSSLKGTLAIKVSAWATTETVCMRNKAPGDAARLSDSVSMQKRINADCLNKEN